MLEWVPIVFLCVGQPTMGPPSNCPSFMPALNEAQLAVEATTGAPFAGTSQELCAAYVENLRPDYVALAGKHGRFVVMGCIGVER